jgi:hypothetical protein
VCLVGGGAEAAARSQLHAGDERGTKAAPRSQLHGRWGNVFQWIDAMEHKPDAMVPENLMTTLVRRGHLRPSSSDLEGVLLGSSDRSGGLDDRRSSIVVSGPDSIVAGRSSCPDWRLDSISRPRGVMWWYTQLPMAWMLNTVRTYPRKVNALMLAVRASKVAMHGD